MMINCLLCKSENGEVFCELDKKYFICASCKFVWCDPQKFPTHEQEKNRYAMHVNSAEDASYINYLGQTVNLAQPYLHAGAKVLDFGSGKAQGIKKILADKCDVNSYDPFFNRDLEVLKISYNLIFCIEVVEHFHDPAKEFALLHNLLEPMGYLVVSSELLGPGIDFKNWYYRRDSTHVSFFQEATVHWLAKAFGFTLVSLKSPHWILRKN